MDLSGQSASQEADGEHDHTAIQNQGTGSAVQADLGRTLVERLSTLKPSHIGQSIKITQGFKVSLRCPPEGPYAGHTQGYHRHGFSLEQLEWLETHVGGTVGHHLWEEGLGDWVYQGSRWGKGNITFTAGTLWADFRLRDRRKAMLFKLIFHGLC